MGWIEGLLQLEVKVHAPQNSFFGRRQHLHFFPRAAPRQRSDLEQNFLLLVSANQLKIISEVRIFPSVDAVRVLHDAAVFRLSVDFCQSDRIKIFTVNQILQHIARANRRQLVRVADQNQPGSLLQRVAQRFRQQQIHHGSFIDDDCLIFERLQRVASKGHSACRFIIIVFQQSVNGTGIMPAGFHDALGSASGRGGNCCFETAPFQNRKQGPDDGCFPCTGTSGNDGHTTAQGDLNRCRLLLRKRDALRSLGFAQHRLFIHANLGQALPRIDHGREFSGNCTFCPIISVKIDHTLTFDLRHL